MALRIAIYGRHSTDKQTSTSSEDQAAACHRTVDYLGGTVVDTYLDPEISEYRRDRPGLKRLLADVRAGRIDLVVSEALDRLARDAEDVAWLGKKLQFDRVRIHTVGEGEIDEIKLAVASLLGALFLSQLKKKTFRGMEAAVLAGRFAGGKADGYRRVIKLDAKGELIRGLLEIDEQQAAIVVRIFREFAAGMSSVQIATGLNRDGIPGPRGGQWNASTIRGDPAKLVGILNNPLYRGRLVWADASSAATPTRTAGSGAIACAKSRTGSMSAYRTCASSMPHCQMRWSLSSAGVVPGSTDPTRLRPTASVTCSQA